MANKLKLNEKFIEIVVDRGDVKSLELVAQIPYIHRNRTNTIFRTSPRNIDLVLQVFRNINAENIDTAPPSIQQLYDMEMQRRLITRSLIENGPSGETKTEHITLMRHQQLAKEIAQVNKKWGFFYDTRTGKTPMSLQIMYEDIVDNPGHKWLVLCPLILIENAWLQDAHDMFPDLGVVSLHAKTQAKRFELFKQKANVYLMNIESFANYRNYVEKIGFTGCFVDESSTMKSSSSKFGKEAVDFAWNLNRWYLLSGSPAPNGEWEYYRQLQSIDFYGVHQSYTQFKQYFFNDNSPNPQYERLSAKPERHEELLELLRDHSLYVDKEDVLTLPGRDFYEVSLTLPEKLRNNYEELKAQLYLDIGDNVVVTAPSTAASLNKLNQVTSGFIIDTQAMKYNKMLKQSGETTDSKEETHFLDGYRFDALEELLADKCAGKQAIIWCVYHKEFEIIKQRLGDRCALVYGGTNITEKNEAIARFKRGEVQWLVANPASADKGLTLTNAHIAIYFSLGYSFELWKQSIERIYGDIRKQPNFCEYYVLIATGTIDRTIYTTVKNKGNMSMAVLDHLKGRV